MKKMKFKESVYLIEILKGLCITVKHALQSVLFIERRSTIEYPDEKKVMPERYRGRHRLTKRPDGSVRCVACYMCATACPANCIYIEAGEYIDKKVEQPCSAEDLRLQGPRGDTRETYPNPTDIERGKKMESNASLCPEKYAVKFEIDILRCVFCGLCVEACPVDAIRMDTGKFELADTSREKLIYDKDFLLKDTVESKVK